MQGDWRVWYLLPGDVSFVHFIQFYLFHYKLLL